MINHKPLKIKERKESNIKETDIYCGGEKVGIVFHDNEVRYDDKVVAIATFNEAYKEADTFDEALRFIENELNEFISNISK